MKQLALAITLLCGLARAQSVSIEPFAHDRAHLRDALADELRARGIDVVTSAGEIVVRGEVHGGRRLYFSVTRGPQVLRLRAAGTNAAIVAQAADSIAQSLEPATTSVVSDPQVELPPSTPRARHATPRSAATAVAPLSRPIDGPPALELEAGFALFGRRLSFRSDLFSRLADFTVAPAPRASVALRWFPLRHFGSELYTNVGIGAYVEGAFALGSVVRGHQQSYSTSANSWMLDARYELPVDRQMIGIAAGYGEETFRVLESPATTLALPRSQITSVGYRFLRTGISTRLRLHDMLTVGATAGWRFVLATGGLDASHGLPASDGGAFDVGLSVGVRLTWFLEVRARADYHRYFFSFHPTPGDYYAVGGATDEWTSGGIDVVVLLPGQL